MSLSKESLERMSACTNAQEVLSILADEGVELNDEQLEAVAGGAAANWSLEELLASFGEAFASLFPEGFDPAVLWGNITMNIH